jgi:DNA repair ATPase RecN
MAAPAPQAVKRQKARFSRRSRRLSGESGSGASILIAIEILVGNPGGRESRR